MLKNKLTNILIKGRDYFFFSFIFVLIFLSHNDHFLNGDEGVVLNGAWNLINGKRLYFDFFEFIPPGSFYLIFFVWKIFGVSFFAAKLFSIVVLFLSILGIFKLGRLIKDGALVYILPFFLALISSWWWIINHNTFNLCFIIWSVYFFVLALNNQKTKYFIFSGLLAGFSLLFLQQKSLVLIASSGLFLLILSLIWKKAVFLKNALAYSLFALAPCLILLLFWPINLLYKNLIWFPLFNYVEVNRMPYGLFTASFFILGIILTLLIITKEKKKTIWFLFFSQFFLLLTIYPLPDIYHLSLVAFPSFILAYYFFSEFFFSKKIKTYQKKIKITIIILSAFWGLSTFSILFPSIFSFSKILGARNQEEGIKNIIEFVNKNCPGQYLYSGPFFPNLYFEAQKLNATPYGILITGHQTEEQFRIATEFLELRRPTCAFLVYPKALERFKHNKNNPAENYIRQNYYQILNSGNWFYVYSLKKQDVNFPN